MVTTDNAFDRYAYDCSINIATLKEELVLVTNNRIFLIGRIKTHEAVLLQFNANLDKLYNKLFTKSELVGIKDANVLTYLYVLIETNNQLITIKKKIKVLESSILDKKLYKIIVRKFNAKARDWMLRGSFALRVKGLGLIKVRTLENSGKVTRINWGDSLKRKAQLIAEGQIPFETFKDENGKVTGNNGGINWLMYQDKRFDTWWYWNKGLVTLPNYNKFSFIPTKPNITALGKILSADSSAYLKFT